MSSAAPAGAGEAAQSRTSMKPSAKMESCIFLHRVRYHLHTLVTHVSLSRGKAGKIIAQVEI